MNCLQSVIFFPWLIEIGINSELELFSLFSRVYSKYLEIIYVVFLYKCLRHTCWNRYLLDQSILSACNRFVFSCWRGTRASKANFTFVYFFSTWAGFVTERSPLLHWTLSQHILENAKSREKFSCLHVQSLLVSLDFLLFLLVLLSLVESCPTKKHSPHNKPCITAATSLQLHWYLLLY